MCARRVGFVPQRRGVQIVYVKGILSYVWNLHTLSSALQHSPKLKVP